MAKKITIAEQFAKVITVLETVGETELATFIGERKALAEKKNASRKPTATQKANEVIAEGIVDYLAENGGKHTVTELIKLVPECAELTNQKVSAILRGLILADRIVKTTEKGKSLFSLAD